jgi:hypothetical protein
MNQLNEIYDNERIEKDTFRSMRELTKYTKILSKGNNLFTIIKKNLHLIKLSSPKSLFKISLLLDTLPEENVSFTFYTEEKNDIKKNNDIKPNKNTIRKKKDVFIIENVDNNLAENIYKNGKGNIIGYNYYFFNNLWKYIYLFNLIISIISLISLSVYSLYTLLVKKYYVLFGSIATSLTLFLNIIACYSGYKKIKSKKKVVLSNENIMMIIFIHICFLCAIYWIYIFNKENNGIKIYVLLIIEIILGLLDLASIILIYLNHKMLEFYQEYSDLYDEGIPLVDV